MFSINIANQEKNKMTKNSFQAWLVETQKQGTAMKREKLLELIRKTNDREFQFVSDHQSKFILVRVRVS
jgi:hypothetical protein